MAQPSLFIERSREKGNSLPFHFSRVSFLSLSLPLSFHSKKRCLEGVERNRIRRRWRCSAIPFLAFGEVIKERRWRGWIDRKSNSWRRDGSSLAVLFIRREGGGLEIGGRARQARSYVWHPTIRGVGWAVIFHPFRRENFIYGMPRDRQHSLN